MRIKLFWKCENRFGSKIGCQMRTWTISLGGLNLQWEPLVWFHGNSHCWFSLIIVLKTDAYFQSTDKNCQTLVFSQCRWFLFQTSSWIQSCLFFGMSPFTNIFLQCIIKEQWSQNNLLSFFRLLLWLHANGY